MSAIFRSPRTFDLGTISLGTFAQVIFTLRTFALGTFVLGIYAKIVNWKSLSCKSNFLDKNRRFGKVCSRKAFTSYDDIVGGIRVILFLMCQEGHFYV